MGGHSHLEFRFGLNAAELKDAVTVQWNAEAHTLSLPLFCQFLHAGSWLHSQILQTVLTKVMGDCLFPKSLYSGHSCFLFPTHIFLYGDFGKFLSDFAGKCRKLSLVEGCLLLSPVLLLTSGKDLAWKGETHSELSACYWHGMSWESLWGQEKCSSPFISFLTAKVSFSIFFKAGLSDNLQQQPPFQLQLLARILSVTNSVNLLILQENLLLQWMFFPLCVCVLWECVWGMIGNRDEVFWKWFCCLLGAL